MHVSVSIVGYRNCDDIVRCLAALERSSHSDFEVIICENGGAGAHDELISRLPRRLAGGQPVHAVLAPQNLGFAGGVNVCLAETPAADAWWVLNPDTEPYPDALALMVKRLSSGDCEAVGNTLLLPNGLVQTYGGAWQSWLARPVGIGGGSSLTEMIDPQSIERRLSYLAGASMLISRGFHETAGPMREDYFLYCEEAEWCIRATSRGMKLGLATEAKVLHYTGTTTGNTLNHRDRSRQSIYLLERNVILLTRDCYPRRLPIAAAASFLLLFLRYARRGAWRQLGYGLSGWVAGMRNRRGAPDWSPA